MARGKADGELDLLFAHVDDAWERTSRTLAMLHNLIEVVGHIMDGKAKFKGPDDFNDSLRGPADAGDDDEDGYTSPFLPAEKVTVPDGKQNTDL